MYGKDEQHDNAVEKMHMIFSEAATIAKEAEVKELWLTHFSPSMSRPEEFIKFASDIFPNAKIGKDLMTTTLKSD